MADDTDPVPDTSGPASLSEVIRSFTHGTADPDALWSALKSSRLPSFPVGQISKAAESTVGMRWCQRCGRPEPEDAGCPNVAFGGGAVGEVAPAGTTCAACSARGVMTLHSPAGDEHAAWEAKWAQDPQWRPDGMIVRPLGTYTPQSGPPEPAAAPPGRASASLPADPFPDTDVLAGMGIAQMLAAMEAGGVDPLRAERIIGAMLAAHGMMAKEAGRDER